MLKLLQLPLVGMHISGLSIRGVSIVIMRFHCTFDSSSYL